MAERKELGAKGGEQESRKSGKTEVNQVWNRAYMSASAAWGCLRLPGHRTAERKGAEDRARQGQEHEAGLRHGKGHGQSLGWQGSVQDRPRVRDKTPPEHLAPGRAVLTSLPRSQTKAVVG